MSHTFNYCDGSRRRRHSSNKAKAKFYARHRARRFAERLGSPSFEH
jgi:hypothetical protein